MDLAIELRVRESDLNSALNTLNLKKDKIITDIKCPVCGSINFKTGIFTKKFKKYVIVILSMIAFHPFGNIEPEYKCVDCGNTFNS